MKKIDVKHIPIKGDGNCLFHSIVKFLELDRKNGYSEQKETHHKLRLKCMNWLRKNLDLKTSTGVTIREQIQFFVDDDNKLKSVNDYLKMMNKNKAYGGQIEIFAISHLLNRNIKTYIDKGNKYSSIGLGNEVKQLRSHDNINDVGSNEENMFHFEILYPRYKMNWRPTDKKKSVPKKEKSVPKKVGVKITKKRSTTKRTSRRNTRRTSRRNRTRRTNRRNRTRRSTRRTNRRTNRRNRTRRSTRRSNRRIKK